MNQNQFQFGIGRLLVLTTVVAIVIAISSRLNGSRLIQGLIVIYLVFFFGWIVMRGPNVIAGLVGFYKKRHRLKSRRKELETEITLIRRSADLSRSHNESSKQVGDVE